MGITPGLLRKLGASQSNANKYARKLKTLSAHNDIDTNLRICHFLAQVFHESGHLRLVEENMNYSADRLLAVFPRYFGSRRLAEEYARKPRRIGSRVYAGRMGNGDEASGDGFRYRGRGLIQLTGKSNYREFGRWVGQDVVAHPELVATDLAVESAIYFWVEHDLNRLADRDDLLAITRKINGGTNGLDDRRRLLSIAKQEIGTIDTPDLPSPTHRVTAERLHLRSRPEVIRSTVLGTLVQGAMLQKIGETGTPNWIRVLTMLDGTPTEGVLNERFTEQIAPSASTPTPAPTIAASIPVAHLREGNAAVKRTVDGRRAHPLGETGLPRRTGTTPATKAKKLLEIARTLDPENPSHLRYQATGGNTFCNIYAYDFCYLANVYLPRVWWTASALAQIARGAQLEVIYGQTVRELRANDLHDWLSEFGPDFGWQRQSSLDMLQAAANAGEVGLIVADTGTNRPGHIASVLPETEDLGAIRNAQGLVTAPITSQAGAINHTAKAETNNWWRRDRYVAYAFWSHN